jgi:pSer/pThr/pTyr-binding forkhead associated (FHA) protein
VTELPPVSEEAEVEELPRTAEPETPPEPVGPRILVLRGTNDGAVPAGSAFKLSAATTIGRGPDNTIALPDRYVSLQHALIYVADGRRLLRDRGSTNGTLLNGTRIHSDMPLRNGDRIEIGTILLEYRE